VSKRGHIRAHRIGSTAKAGLAGDDVAPIDVQPIGHQAKRKISHLANSEITQMADASVSRLCYTVGRDRIRWYAGNYSGWLRCNALRLWNQAVLKRDSS